MRQVRGRPAVADSSPARIMARVGARANVPWLTNILRQSGATYSPAKLNEIADSLVARAVDPRAAVLRSEEETRALAAIDALKEAGARGREAGRPYPGALDRLIAVHQRASKEAIRATALQDMLAVSDRSLAIAYLQKVAESTDVTAYEAVAALVADANGSGWGAEKPSRSEQQQTVTAVKALAARQRVTDQRARTMLAVWISQHPSNSPSK